MGLTAGGITFIASAGGAFAVGCLRTARKLALSGHRWQAAITASGQSALAHPAVWWALSEWCSIPMEQQHYFEGWTDDGQLTGWVTQLTNNREVKEHSNQVKFNNSGRRDGMWRWGRYRLKTGWGKAFSGSENLWNSLCSGLTLVRDAE